MFSANEITQTFEQLGVTHVVWVPDSTFGTWEAALDGSDSLRLLRVCREGEAWPLAAGLHMAGKNPLIIMQSTGLFESGDALRNVLFDLQVPLFAVIGARNWLIPDSPDSARRFIEPVLQAWQLNYVTIESPSQKPALEQHYRTCRQAGRSGIAVIAEGKG